MKRKKVFIIDQNEYEKLPFTLCDALWKISKKSYGVKMINRETEDEIDEDTMRGLFINSFREVLDNI